MSLPSRSNINNYNAAGKINDQNNPPAVVNLDWDNPSLARGMSDVAALGQTAPRFWCRLQLATTTAGLSVLNWEAQWINATPTAPVPFRTTTGSFTITLPTMVSDEYDASVGVTSNIAVNLNAATVSFEGNTSYTGNASASGNVITIYTFSGGSLNDLSGKTAFIQAF